MKPAPTILFMGTASFAVPTLNKLIAAGFQIPAVVTAPDRPAGRGKKLRQSPVKEFALSQNIPVLQPIKLRDPEFVQRISDYKPDLQIVVAFRMLPEVVWRIPAFGTINLHASLLPDYRGAAPINHVLFNGETTSGVTTFFIDDKIDTGEILEQRKVSIEPEETAGELHDRLMILGADLMVDTVQKVLDGTATPIRQQQLRPKGDPLKTAPKLRKEDLKINWSESLENVYNKIRGLSPVPGAYTRLHEKNGKFRILKVFYAEKLSEEKNNLPGTVHFGKKTMMIACKNGMVSLREVQLEGKKRMTIEDFILGIQTKNILRAE